MSQRFELLMDAGNGAQKAGDILIQVIAAIGQHVFIEPLIPAEISPPKRTPYSMSGVVIRYSDDALRNIGNYSNWILVEHEILLNRRLDDQEYEEGATIFLDMADAKRSQDDYDAAIQRARDAGLTVIPIHRSEEIDAFITDLGGRGKNMSYLGIIAAVLDLPMDRIESVIRSQFAKLPDEVLQKNVDLSKTAYTWAKKEITPQFQSPIAARDHSFDTQVLLDGNTALAMGIIDAGIKLYSGYPITPASSILHVLSQQFSKYGGTVHQAEDEISAIGTVIGSYYAGMPAISATSGPGFSLKQEFLGLATAAEVPCILIDVQRGGPSTGLPTRTEQSDLAAAIFGTHGDNTKIVISVCDVEDCFYAPHVARYLTETLKVPVIILSDYMSSVSYKVLDSPKLAVLGDDVNEIPDWILERFGLKRLPDNIEMVVHEQSIPGTPEKMRRVTGLNTDESGHVEYSASSTLRAHEIRNQKIHTVQDSMLEPEIYGDDSGDLLLVGWGSSRGAIVEAVEMARAKGQKVSACILKVVHPLPPQLAEIGARFKQVQSVELSYGDEQRPSPFTMLLRSATLLDVRPAITTATGRPIKPIEIFNQIERALS